MARHTYMFAYKKRGEAGTVARQPQQK